MRQEAEAAARAMAAAEAMVAAEEEAAAKEAAKTEAKAAVRARPEAAVETSTASPTLEPLTLTRSKRGSKQKRAAQAALTAASRPRRLDAELLAAADDAVELPTAAEAVGGGAATDETAATVKAAVEQKA